MTFPIDFSDEELEKLLLGDMCIKLLMEKLFNQILQAEMTKHSGADWYEGSPVRRGHWNGFYERQLNTRRPATLEVPL